MEQENNRSKILDINNSIWVSASAGSGKTTVLVDRLLCLLINDVDISKIVCITYTKTGANEMKSRIYDILARWTIMDDEQLKLEIQKKININTITKEYLNKTRSLFTKVIDNIDNLKIFTIHSFCQQIIGRFPIEAGIYPNFDIIDDYKVKELINKAIANVMLSSLNDEHINKCLKNILANNSEDQFQKLIGHIIEKRKEFETLNRSDYRSDLKKLFKVHTETQQDIIDDFLNYDYHEVKQLCDHIENNYSTKTLKNIAKAACYIGDKDKIKDYINCFLTATGTARKPNSSDFEKENEYCDILLKEANRCINYISDMENYKYFSLSCDLIDFGLKIINNYKVLKNNEGLLDFDDLITITLDLLNNSQYSSWINYKLDNGIEHILLDEAQDTSKLQWDIMENLTNDFFSGETKNNNRTLFVVGDEKQSIFSFQGADPTMFDNRFRFYREKIEVSRNNFYKVNLSHSFRSLDTILKFVDAVFSDDNYRKKITTLEPKIEHHNKRLGTGLVELWPLVNVKIKEKNDGWTLNFENDEETQKREILAKYITEKIKHLVDSNRAIITRDNKKRKIEFGDIMVLVKDRSGEFLSYLISYFNKNNIPNSGTDRVDLFSEIIIEDFISLFKFIIFQNDDLSLANLVKSSFLNLTEDDLYNLCRYKVENDTTLLDSFKNIEKYSKQYLFLADIIEKSQNLSVYNLCFYLLENCKIRTKILSRYGYEANIILDNFLDFVIKYEEDNFSNLVSFVSFVNDNENKIKKDLNNNTNQVRIMTVHASKGMQSPIVFLANANAKIDENKDTLFWCDNLPIYKTGAKMDVIKDIKDKNGFILHGEYFRLFYVATTRTENELYICGLGNTKGDSGNEEIKKDKEEKQQTWYDLSKLALDKLGAKAKIFELDPDCGSNKLVYGEENFVDIITSNSNDSNDNKKSESIDNIIENIKVYNTDNTQIKKTISPSQFYNHIDRDDRYDKINLAITRGNAIHKLLEILPNSKKTDAEKIADIYLNNYFYNLDKDSKCQIKKTVLDVLNNDKFKQFFTENSKSEVAIVGSVDDYDVSGQIDRLVEYDDRILILDYKNTSKNYKNVEELPQEYIKQLELYKKLIEKIYKDRTVECYVLITSYSNLIKVF